LINAQTQNPHALSHLSKCIDESIAFRFANDGMSLSAAAYPMPKFKSEGWIKVATFDFATEACIARSADSSFALPLSK